METAPPWRRRLCQTGSERGFLRIPQTTPRLAWVFRSSPTPWIFSAGISVTVQVPLFLTLDKSERKSQLMLDDCENRSTNCGETRQLRPAAVFARAVRIQS